MDQLCVPQPAPAPAPAPLLNPQRCANAACYLQPIAGSRTCSRQCFTAFMMQSRPATATATCLYAGCPNAPYPGHPFCRRTCAGLFEMQYKDEFDRFSLGYLPVHEQSQVQKLLCGKRSCPNKAFPGHSFCSRSCASDPSNLELPSHLTPLEEQGTAIATTNQDATVLTVCQLDGKVLSMHQMPFKVDRVAFGTDLLALSSFGSDKFGLYVLGGEARLSTISTSHVPFGPFAFSPTQSYFVVITFEGLKIYHVGSEWTLTSCSQVVDEFNVAKLALLWCSDDVILIHSHNKIQTFDVAQERAMVTIIEEIGFSFSLTVPRNRDDQAFIATHDNVIQCVDLQTGTMEGNSRSVAEVERIATNADGDKIVVKCVGRGMQAFDTSPLNHLWKFNAFMGLADILTIIDDKVLIAGSESAMLVELETGKLIRTINLSGKYVTKAVRNAERAFLHLKFAD